MISLCKGLLGMPVYICMFIKKIHYDSNKGMFFLALYAQNISTMKRLTYFDKIISRF